MINLKKITTFYLVVAVLGTFGQTGTRKIASTKNQLENTSWKVDAIPFENTERESYTLTETDEDLDWHWGNFIKFEENTFSSWYSAPCGNDCFTSVYGEYSFVDAHVIEIKVIKIERYGFCSEKSEEINKNYGQYKLEKTELGWTLNKINR